MNIARIQIGLASHWFQRIFGWLFSGANCEFTRGYYQYRGDKHVLSHKMCQEAKNQNLKHLRQPEMNGACSQFRCVQTDLGQRGQIDMDPKKRHKEYTTCVISYLVVHPT